ncbi:uncharacterized protein LOC134222502 [Armigeres subalbatus]|uniref:uncharacterized protein LOC134222502 n=1 Tax=Armigeres subalbatus TaxID=124917 RepID=UPI002ED2360D
MENFDGLWENINEALNAIEVYDDYPEGEESCGKERAEYANRYEDCKTRILDLLKLLEQPGQATSDRAQGSGMHDVAEHVRLPQIKLQTFDGNIDEWLSFRDLYTSLIHLKADLPDVEKFHYLKGCLAGEAKSLIDPLAITNINYQVAWKTLMNRYNDSKLLKRRQVQTLFKLPSLGKESASELQSLLEKFERVIQTLDQIVQPADYKDLLLVEIMCSRLDPTTRRCWEENSATKEQDKVKDLIDFLQTRTKILGSLPLKPSEKRETPKMPSRKPSLTRSSHNAVYSTGLRCLACSESHLLFQCPAFQRMSVSSRDKLLRSHSLCRNCFRRGHQANECTSKYVCRSCKGKHHTLVCFHSENTSRRGASADRPSTSSAQFSSETNSNAVDTTVSSNMAINHSAPVLLATAIVLVEDDEGVAFPTRALLDSGSECNFMAERLCQKMKIKRKRSNIDVVGIGQSNMKVRHRVEAKIKSRISPFSQSMEFLILPTVTSNLPATTAIDLVIGIQHFFDLIKSRKISLGNGLPTLNDSVFGWIVSGMVNDAGAVVQKSCYTAMATGFEELINRFWSCEELETSNNYSPEEERCEEHFKRTVRISENGRYTVSYPRNHDKLVELGESRDIVVRRLLWLERRLDRDPELHEQYKQFMVEYEQLGHMRKVVDTGKEGALQRCFLPHHPVVKQDSTTTKVRVVFDASSKTRSGTSLNDALLVGPVIQDDLRSIILRCRMVRIMLVADVEKMFRQILICQDDIPLQTILWRTDEQSEIQWYELTTVTYGTKPAPYLATRTLQQLAEDEQLQFPMAARAVKKDVYMDDVLTGTNTEEEAMELRTQLDSMLSKGGFSLRKWASNCPKVLEGIPKENLAIANTEEVSLDPDPSVKTLGLVWLPGTDRIKFRFKVGIPNFDEDLSKQSAKVHLHIFSDASERAYGTCAYTRSENHKGEVWAALLTSKSKVAPLRRQSIPRLELCGALLSAQLAEKILESIQVPMEVFFWSDSTCALQWIKGNPSMWTTFVGNRVAKIQRITEKYSWNHVAGVDNPADLISRGIGPDQIHTCTLWWEGPPWLKKMREEWPSSSATPVAQDVEAEFRSTAHCANEKPEGFVGWYISKFPSYTDVLRRTAIWQRLIRILRKEPKSLSYANFNRKNSRANGNLFL